MELNREQIIKALECCKSPLSSDCENCSYTGKRLEDGVYEGCVNCLVGDALSLIKELTEENERLSQSLANSKSILANSKADTVRKMETKSDYEKGYRKASEVAGEIIKAADEIINTICIMTGIEITAVGGKYLELRKKYADKAKKCD